MWKFHSRRQFATSMAAFAALASLPCGAASAEEGPPETTSVRLPAFAGASDCMTPMYVATELLRQEGIIDVSFVSSGTGPDSSDWLAHGELDFDWNFPPAYIGSIEAGVPLTVLTGLHVGCLELIAGTSVQSVPDLRGRKLGVDVINGINHLLLRVILSYVGVDPDRDVEWTDGADLVQLLADGEIDAFMGTPPQPQIVRERGIGHVILKTAYDRPWSQYYCCMLAAASGYVQQYPNATKRIVRSLLKSIDLCQNEPETAADQLMRTGFGSKYEYAMQTLAADARYDVWRSYDPEDSMRFYALRMKEVGEISMSPQNIIAKGTDWRIYNELKRELKG